ncbi:hypothetical protein V7S43_007624 [Phytophthora oleae]|uniref:Uncharacterized protein n=1 Tax=Phytophthora oleae TaxID=2107226 RepID=A0ABD3FKG7_9STRA
MAIGSSRPVNHVHAGNSKPKPPVLGKRKAQPAPMKDVHYNYGSMKCRYCFGNHNDMDNTGPHKLPDCPKRARDLLAGVKRPRTQAASKECEASLNSAHEMEGVATERHWIRASGP